MHAKSEACFQDSLAGCEPKNWIVSVIREVIQRKSAPPKRGARRGWTGQCRMVNPEWMDSGGRKDGIGR